MKKIILITLFVFLNASALNYKLHKIIQSLHNFPSKKEMKFLPIKPYNIFPVNIDQKINLKTYLKKQALIINLKAISGKRAYINNKWYKQGSKIQDLIVYKITNSCVFFKTSNKSILTKIFVRCISPNLIKVEK